MKVYNKCLNRGLLGVADAGGGSEGASPCCRPSSCRIVSLSLSTELQHSEGVGDDARGGEGMVHAAVGGGGEVLVAREGEGVVHAAVEGGGEVLVAREGRPSSCGIVSL